MTLLEQLRKTSVRAQKEVIARVIVDTHKKKLLFVPAALSHPEFLALHLGKNEDELKNNPECVESYVGATLGIENERVTAILVGISGLETLFRGIRLPVHEKKTVNTAKNILLATVQAAGCLEKGFNLRVCYL